MSLLTRIPLSLAIATEAHAAAVVAASASTPPPVPPPMIDIPDQAPLAHAPPPRDHHFFASLLARNDEPFPPVHVIDGRAFIENRTVDEDGYLVTQAVDADDFLLRRSQYYRQQQQEEEAKMQQQQQQEQSQKQPQLQHQFQQQSQHHQQQQLLAQNASVSENGPITVNNINSAGLDRSQPQELPGASGMSDQLSDQSQQEEGGEQSPEQPQYQPLDPSVQAAPVSEDGPLSVNDIIPAGLDHPQSQEPLGASGEGAQFSDQSQTQFT